MTAKEYLSKYRSHMSNIVFYEAMKEEAITNIASLRSPNFDERVKSTPQNDPIGNLVVQLERDITKYNLEILSCRAKIILIDNQLCALLERSDIQDREIYYKILSYKYKLGMNWDEIAEKMMSSRSFVTHLHSPALQIFDELYGDTYRLL